MEKLKNSGFCSSSSSRNPTRRDFAVCLAAVFSGFGVAGDAYASARYEMVPPVPIPEISRSAEAIHQEVNFNAAPAQVYGALTDATQFNRVVQLSAAMKSMAIPDKAGEIARELGGPFSLFGGYVTGRHIELNPNQRIVQAWRASSWDAGLYSIARFELSSQGSGTKLVFDHTGFPLGQAEHLLAGWNGNYWEPLAKFLAEPK